MLFSVSGLAQAKKIESIYTDLTATTCKKLKADSDNGVLYSGECRGVGGYKLILLEGEHRQLLNLVTPKGMEIELNLAQDISAAPSSLGNKVEWRVQREGKKLKPFALIVRLNIFDNPDNSEKAKSYLVVAKIAGETACVTDVVEPAVPNQNAKARELADASVEKSCLLMSKIPKFIEQLAGADYDKAREASDVLINIGPSVVAPLLDKMKQMKLCDFQLLAAKVILKLDKNNAVLKPTLFDLARGKCEYRYSPEKYLPDVNFVGVIAQFEAAELLVSEIEGGIFLLPELKNDDGSPMLSLIYGLRGAIVLFGNKNKANRKPEVIRVLKATVPMLVMAVEKEGGKICVDFYEMLQWMRQSGIDELRDEVNRALEGKTIRCGD